MAIRGIGALFPGLCFVAFGRPGVRMGNAGEAKKKLACGDGVWLESEQQYFPPSQQATPERAARTKRSGSRFKDTSVLAGGQVRDAAQAAAARAGLASGSGVGIGVP